MSSFNSARVTLGNPKTATGQTMITPRDITVEEPSLLDLPYAGLLYLSGNYLTVTNKFADKSGVTIGIVGPSSGAEQAQKLVHSAIGADEPKGWDTQLHDEIVFQLSRGRAGRLWASNTDNMDLLFNIEGELGTLSSSVVTGLTVRYGKKLVNSFATVLFNRSRATNTIAIDGAWFAQIGVNASYTFNQIFTDGNTFRDSRSVEYDPAQIGVSAGISYSWSAASFSFAVHDTGILQDETEELRKLTEYGTFTFAWKY